MTGAGDRRKCKVQGTGGSVRRNGTGGIVRSRGQEEVKNASDRRKCKEQGTGETVRSRVYNGRAYSVTLPDCGSTGV